MKSKELEQPFFNYTLTVLSHELEKLQMHRQKFISYQIENRIAEIKYVIEILNQGQGYLTEKSPIKIKFFKDVNFI